MSAALTSVDQTGSFLQHQYQLLGISEYMQSTDITEICINRPGEIHLETSSGWRTQSVPELTLERARQFCVATLNESNTGQRISDAQPLVSLTLPTGQRAQFVIPPACAPGELSITIRMPSKRTLSLPQYAQAGFFDHVLQQRQGISEQDSELLELCQRRDYTAFFAKAVQYRRNIVVAGATGSGKTTFMKSLVAQINQDERVVTIEDARELFIAQHNRVHLLYSKGNQGSATVNAKDCMEACLRMRPDRIILAELRGDETFYFMRNCASGHPGTITSCHAGSTSQTWDQLALMIKASQEGSNLDYAVIQRLLRLTIDIVVHVQAHNGRRHVSAIEFDPARSWDGEPRTMLNDFAHCPGLDVDWALMRHVVAVESSFNPHAIGVVGTPLARQPDSLQQAVAMATQLSAQGRNFSVGLAQINVHNFEAQGLHGYEQAFEPCTNLRAGARILAECRRRHPRWEQALSCYYSGNAQTGFDHGYVQNIVQRVLQAAAGSSAPPRMPPSTAPTLRQRRLQPSVPLHAVATPSPNASTTAAMPVPPAPVLNTTTTKGKNP